MPLTRSRSDSAFRQNVAEMIRSGHPQNQALAAAYRIKRQARAFGGRMADGGDPTADIFSNPLNDVAVGERNPAAWPDLPAKPFPGEEGPYYSEGAAAADQSAAAKAAQAYAPGKAYWAAHPKKQAEREANLDTAANLGLGAASMLAPELFPLTAANSLYGAGRHGVETGDYGPLALAGAGLAGGSLLQAGMRYAPALTAAGLGAYDLFMGSTRAGDAPVSDPLAAAEQSERDAVDKWVGQEPKQADFETNRAYRKALVDYKQRQQDAAGKYQTITDKYLTKKQQARDAVSDDDLNDMQMTRDNWHMLSPTDQNQKLLQLSAQRQQKAEADRIAAAPLRENYPEVGLAPYIFGTVMGGVPYFNRWRAQGLANDFNLNAAENAAAGERAIQRALSAGKGEMSEGQALAANAAIARAEQDMALAPTRGAATAPFRGWGAWAAQLPQSIRHGAGPSLFTAELAALPEEYDWLIGKRGVPGHPEYVDEARNRLFSTDTAERMATGAATPITLREMGNIVPVFRKTVPFPEEKVAPFIQTYKEPMADQLARAQQRGLTGNLPAPAGPVPMTPPAPIGKTPRAKRNKPGGKAGVGQTSTPVSPELNELLKTSDWPEFARGGAAGLGVVGSYPPYRPHLRLRQYADGGSPEPTPAPQAPPQTETVSPQEAQLEMLTLPPWRWNPVLYAMETERSQPNLSGLSSSSSKSSGAQGRAWGGPAFGGSPYTSWLQRHEAENIARPMHVGPIVSGPIMSAVPGRTDRHNVNVASGSYVIPAESISHLGQSNSIAGMHIAHNLFGPSSPHSPANMAFRHAVGIPRPPRMPFTSEGGARGDPRAGQSVPVVLSGGEYVVTPDVIRNIGGGSLADGHRVMDKFIMNLRKDHIATLKRLPPPAKK
jgi:uncharacterized protein YecT (DUF1311 family)